MLRPCLPALLLTPALLQAQVPAARWSAELQAQASRLGLGPDAELRPGKIWRDGLGQTHARLQRFHRGVRVWGADAVAHLDGEGRLRPLAGVAPLDLPLEVQPRILPAEALYHAVSRMAPQGEFARPPRAELVLFPAERLAGLRLARSKAGRLELDETLWAPAAPRRGHVLCYHVRVEVENAKDGVQHRELLIDAETGALLQQWDGLRAAEGTGNSLYSGTVALQTSATASGFELRDGSRPSRPHPLTGVLGNETRNLRFASGGLGEVYADPDDAWGDGQPFDFFHSTTSDNGQTAGVDAHYGLQATWDFYAQVFGRHGIDGQGTSTFNRVHFLDRFFFNAFWNDSCFCMSYGDGGAYPLSSLDIAGHEMSHGVMSSEANLDYIDESGGLNEANSDILGTMAEFHARGGSGAVIGDTGGNWVLGEQVVDPPLRYMYKPSLDGISYDAWFDGMGFDDVHFTSGPANRMFYFLSQGATASGDTRSEFVPEGFPGIGNDRAAALWYRAVTTYLTSSSDYAAAREALLQSAVDLFGPASPEYAAVQNAFAAVGIGAPADGLPRPEVRFKDFGWSRAIGSPYIAVVPAGRTTRFAAEDRSDLAATLLWQAEDVRAAAPVPAEGGDLRPEAGRSSLIRLTPRSASQPLAFAQRFVYAVELDLNHDGAVDPEDLGRIAFSYGRFSGEVGMDPAADLSGNSFVNDYDLSLLFETFGLLFQR